MTDTDTTDSTAPDLPKTVADPEYQNTVPEGPETLVSWKGRGPYHCVHMEHGQPLRDGQANLIPRRLKLLPGLNLAPSGLLDVLKDNNPLFMAKIDSGEIEELGDPRGFAKRVKPERSIDMVTSTADVRALEAILEHERRDKVVEALEDEILELRRRDSQGSDSRRDQRRARRRARARR